MRLVQLVGLLPIGGLFGNELATLFIHRALFGLAPAHHVAAEQAIHQVLGRVMPVYMISAIVAACFLALAATGMAATVFATIAVASLLAMLAITLVGNVPINNETVRLPLDVDVAYWRALRRRWLRLHVGRIALDGIAFFLAGASVLVK